MPAKTLAPDPEGLLEDWESLKLRRPTPKTYVGRRTSTGKCQVKVVEGDTTRKLPLSRTLMNHSQAFEWGYGGSGPAQLALAILYEFLGDTEKAVRYHQKFKEMIIARLPRDEGWTLSEAMVKEALEIIVSSEKD